MPVALDGWWATFVFAQTEDETPSAVWTWGSQHTALWAALPVAGRVCGHPRSECSTSGDDGSRVRDDVPQGRSGRDGPDPQGQPLPARRPRGEIDGPRHLYGICDSGLHFFA